MVKPVVLIILDGWGIAPPGPGNAISLAKLTHMPSFWQSYPHSELSASGEAVGLPSGEDGNTETGHLNIGAGRVVYQDLPRINMAIADGSFFTNDAFLAALRYSQEHHSNIHLMGVVSDAGVHASREHLYALLQLLERNGRKENVYLHIFTDGRDAPPRAGARFVSELATVCKTMGVGTIATVMGRYFGMDRDRRWDRTEKAYVALTEPIEKRSPSAESAIKASYEANVTDEFIDPVQIIDAKGNVLPRIANHDAVIFFNYRIDRPRQLTRAFVLSDFETHIERDSFDPYLVKYYKKHVVQPVAPTKLFTRAVKLPNLFFVTMTEYERDVPCTVAYPTAPIANTLGEVLSKTKLRQLRMAETEKERFVTYYFNGMHEMPFPGEDRLIVPSPKVATYDLAPAMSALEVTEQLVNRLTSGIYGLTVVNFANPDMVAHTGNIAASIIACETADTCIGKIVEATVSQDGTCIVTADHGNVEEMLGPNGEVDTEHSTFPVPFIMINHHYHGYGHDLPKGKLADIAPTILSHLGLPIPTEMTGKNLLADFHI
ncbi:2,3-bisphosphoglycerate-independent phosphoglycerate mutase [Candidatus Gottesmanbacteria bacterium]|nr:2,3-bisphosphoglycerate-independent phosphoglycerate mutase [Candidatus Gottesmanbacteria bacterium]